MTDQLRARLVLIQTGESYLPDPFTLPASFPLTKPLLLIGRARQQVDICLTNNDPTAAGVSRNHCLIRYDPQSQAYYLVDLGSTNGTRLNNHTLEPQRSTLLHDGDFIDLGKRGERAAIFRFFLEELAAPVGVHSRVGAHSSAPVPPPNSPAVAVPPELAFFESLAKPAPSPIPEDEDTEEPTFMEPPNVLLYLSYSRKDADFVRHLQDSFSAAGLLKQVEVWADRSEVGSAEWGQKLENVLRISQVVIAVLSPDAKRSPNVAKELTLAQTYKRPVLPVLARGTLVEALPPALMVGGQWFDLREMNYTANLPQLIQAIQKYL